MHTHILLRSVFSIQLMMFTYRRVWGSLQRHPESAWEERSGGGCKDPEAWLHGEAETGFSKRGLHHGTVLPPEHHSSRGGGHQMWAQLKAFSPCFLLIDCRLVKAYTFFCFCSVKHAMIVTEFMENGALDRYLRVRPIILFFQYIR